MARSVRDFESEKPGERLADLEEVERRGEVCEVEVERGEWERAGLERCVEGSKGSREFDTDVEVELSGVGEEVREASV